MSSSHPWACPDSVGGWTFRIAPQAKDGTHPLDVFRSVFRRMAIAAAPLHRIREGLVSWAVVGTAGTEAQFNELVHVDKSYWTDMDMLLERMFATSRPDVRSAPSLLFLTLDTLAVGPDRLEWLVDSAELQLSVATVVSGPPDVTISYSTTVDIWLPETRDAAGFPRDNRTFSEPNLPRLKTMLTYLEEMSLSTSWSPSRRYGDVLREQVAKV